MKSALPVIPQSDLERLKGAPSGDPEVEKARLHKVSKEFESLFLYQMLKTMRQTIPEQSMAGDAPLAGSSGKDTFTELFDMELSRRMAGDGRGSISDILYRQLERKLGVDPEPAKSTGEFRSIEPQVRPATDVSPKEFNPISAAKRNTSGVPISQDIALDQRLGVNLKTDRILSKYGEQIDKAAQKTGLDPALIYAVIKAESSGDRKAVSSAGAKGLMQLTDGVAKQYGVDHVFSASQNIAAGSAYLSDLLNRFGDLRLALAAYNAGPGNVKKYGGIPPFPETENYVRTVTDTLSTSLSARDGTHAKVR